MPDKKTDADGNVAQFCAVTGATYVLSGLVDWQSFD